MKNASDDNRPELKYIHITKLFPPKEYQRSIKSDASRKNINQIKVNFNWAAFGALIVCPLKESEPMEYGIVDGQHRHRAAILTGRITELPCVVIPLRDIPEQARDFVSINEARVPLHPLSRYKAMITAGDKDAVALESILAASKIGLSNSITPSGNIPPRVTQAVGTLLKMVKAGVDRDDLIWVLTIIPEAYGNKTTMMSAKLIKILVQIKEERPDIKRDTMMQVLREMDADTLQIAYLEYRSQFKCNIPTAIKMVLLNKYSRVSS